MPWASIHDTKCKEPDTAPTFKGQGCERAMKGAWAVEGASAAARLWLRKEPHGQQGPLISMTHSLAPQRSRSGATLINTRSLQECGGNVLMSSRCARLQVTLILVCQRRKTHWHDVCVWTGRGDRERGIEGRLINVSICQWLSFKQKGQLSSGARPVPAPCS